MKSLGVIETRGLVAAIQAIDAACKSAEVTCIGYRKVGSGRVSVCFEGEISAIHTAIERGMAVINTVHPQARSLVIARPEGSVTEALSRLKGYPSRAEVKVDLCIKAKAEVSAPASREIDALAEPASLSAPDQEEEKQTATKKGRKA
jgi:microcompartment protein CcmL/EutN